MKTFLLGFAFLAAGIPSTRTLHPSLPGQILDISEDNFFIRAPGSARPGLTTVRMTSPHGGHQFELYRLNEGHSVNELVTALSADKSPAWAIEMGGAGYPPKGGTVNASYILEPGKYAILCAVHDKRDGLRHYQKGMFTEFTVAGRRVRGALPKPDVTVSEVEYSWKLSKPLSAGPHVLRVTNNGTNVHEMKILKVLPGHTYAEVKAWKPGHPRVDEPFATVTTMQPGVSVITSITFPKGDYVLWCVPQSKNGMSQAISVR
jgi:hypothetical protein